MRAKDMGRGGERLMTDICLVETSKWKQSSVLGGSLNTQWRHQTTSDILETTTNNTTIFYPYVASFLLRESPGHPRVYRLIYSSVLLLSAGRVFCCVINFWFNYAHACVLCTYYVYSMGEM